MIYTAHNTPYPVDVFVNGNKVDGVVRADTERNEVTYCPEPLRVQKNKRDEIYTRILRGEVTVKRR